MLLLHNAILTAKHSRMVDYGPEAFEPVAGTGEVGMVITVRSSSEYESLGELLLAAKQNPDTITFGANLGALTHYAGLALENLYPGAAFRYIQLGGGAKRLSNLIGGHIEVTGFSIEEYIRFSSEGQLRGLAYFGPERHPRAPDVPTAREAGFDLTSSNIFYWWFPKGTSPERIEVLATALEKAMRTEYVQTKMTEIHCRPIFLKGEGLRRRIQVAAKEFASIPRPEPPDLPNFPAIILAAIVILLAVIMVDHHRSVGHREHELSTLRDETGSVPRNGLAIICVGMTVIYVLVMSEGWVSFRFATIAFVFAVGAALTRSRFLNLPVVGTLAAIALFMGLGLGYLFTQVFVIDLP